MINYGNLAAKALVLKCMVKDSDSPGVHLMHAY